MGKIVGGGVWDGEVFKITVGVVLVLVVEDRNSMWAAVDRDCVVATVKINGEMFISSFDNTRKVVGVVSEQHHGEQTHVWLMLDCPECESFYWWNG